MEIEKLDGKAKRQVMQLLDWFIECENLKQQMKARTTPIAKPRTQRDPHTNAQEAQA